MRFSLPRLKMPRVPGLGVGVDLRGARLGDGFA